MAVIREHSLSAIVGLAIVRTGIWWVSDGCMDPMPSYHPEHFIEGELRWNRGDQWRCGDYAIWAPTPDHFHYPPWKTFLDLANGDIERHRARAEDMLQPWVNRPETVS